MSDETYPKGRVIEVKATLVLPATATEEQIDDWISHCVFDQGGISTDNPLLPIGIDAENIEWDDTGTYRQTIVSDIRKTESGLHYRVRRLNLPDDRSEAEIEGWKSPEDAKTEALAIKSSQPPEADMANCNIKMENCDPKIIATELRKTAASFDPWGPVRTAALWLTLGGIVVAAMDYGDVWLCAGQCNAAAIQSN